jgi:hypothetical protein
MRFYAVLVAVVGIVLPSHAMASSIRQMTFTGIPDFFDGTAVWVEDGITARGGIAFFTEPNAVHLDTNATSYGPILEFETGFLFDALSIDVRPLGTEYCSAPMGADCDYYDDPYPYIWVSGFADDLLVSTLGIYRPYSGAFQTLVLGDAFSQIDRLTVEVRHATQQLGLSGFCGYPCAHVDVDNVKLTDVAPPIPEPTAAILFALGLILVARARRRADRP